MASNLSSADRPVPHSLELTAVILTLNEAAHIQACIESLCWADHVVVFDSFSQDNTVLLAEAAGAQVIQSRFQNFAQQRNDALDSLQTDWVFFVDADERGTPELAAEIRQVIETRPEAGWYVPRLNYIFGKLTRGAGWFPDYQFRLLKHGKVRYERPVHEIAVVDGDTGKLTNPLIHHNYRDWTHFRNTQRSYTNYEASILHDNGIRPWPHKFITQPLRHFWWRFITLKGYTDKLHGLRLSLFMAYYEWIKYWMLIGIWIQAKRKGVNSGHR